MTGEGMWWRDRTGAQHRERSTRVPMADPPIPRVRGPIEAAWAATGQRGGDDTRRERDALTAIVLGRTNPLITDDPDGSGTDRIFTWVSNEAKASRVLLWINGLFDHTRVEDSEMTRLEGSDLWTISLLLPATWRGSYRIGVWAGPGEAPWRLAEDRMGVRRAALDLGCSDPRGTEEIHGTGGATFSVATGPAAPPRPWPIVSVPAGAHPRVDLVDLGPQVGGGTSERVWVHRPPVGALGGPTPLLVLFDGQVWNEQLRLPDLLDAMIRAGRLAPLHVAMLDSHDVATRWGTLGVPSGQVDVVLDQLLPVLRESADIDPSGEATVVSGQSLGGLSALWTVSLSAGEVRHAIAQSPSLWRFDVAEALTGEDRWSSVCIQSGLYEGDMLADAHALIEDVRRAEPGTDRIRLEAIEGGHDWAWWRVHLLRALVDLFPGPSARGE